MKTKPQISELKDGKFQPVIWDDFKSKTLTELAGGNYYLKYKGQYYLSDGCYLVRNIDEANHESMKKVWEQTRSPKHITEFLSKIIVYEGSSFNKKLSDFVLFDKDEATEGEVYDILGKVK